MNENVIKAALLGFGTVGTGVYKVLKNQEKEMSAKEKKFCITKDKNSEIIQNTKDKTHELNTPDK